MSYSIIKNSSSSRTKNFDVFVSFRGGDTRNGFTDHLFAALQRKGVIAFRDNLSINKGELLEPELLQAIQGSRIFIVVFSKDYASSTWCLKELTNIIDLAEQTGRTVLPVFYDVTPSEVRYQSGKFGEAFAKHEERLKGDLEMVKKWREALKAIANRSGWDVQNKPHHEEIENLVEKVVNILGHNQILSFEDDFVDVHSRVKQLEELLSLGATEIVRVIGICGMGGIGKTTLASALYNKIFPQFDVCCFIDDLSKVFRDFGPLGAQKQLLCQTLDQGNVEINNSLRGAMLVRNRLCNVKALIVLDNVDHVEQLEKLALHPKYLGAGSRMIIISRDSHILKNYGVDEVYSVQLLDPNNALQLFRRRAFKSDDIVEKYEELTCDALKYANGLPLAIKVLGSYLFDRNIVEWRSALARLRENPSKDIMDVLRISFDGLDEMEKEIFLDIACFYSNGYWLDEVKKLLAHRGYYRDIGMKVLIEKSLISLKEFILIRNKQVIMHDLLKELGRSIVRAKSPKEPRKWCRLWDYKDLHNVMTENKEAQNLEAIVIKERPSEFEETTMKVDALSKMNNLQFAIFSGVKFSGNLRCLSNELRYLCWDKYPFTCLPANFHPRQLVELILPNSNIKQLWEGPKHVPYLRTLNINSSKNLIEMPDLRGAPHLKRLILKECKNVIIDLNIILGLTSLEELNLSGCSKLQNNYLSKKPRETEYLEEIDKNTSTIQLLTSSASRVLIWPFHFLSSPKSEDLFVSMLPYLPRFQSLFDLDLSFCNLLHIPDAIGNLHSLVRLDLGGNKFVSLPTTMKQLSKLQYLNLQHCKRLIYLPQLSRTEVKFEKEFYPYTIGLYIFDCSKLRETEQCYNMFFSWIKQNLEAYMRLSPFSGASGVVIPGSQIPRWFSEQNEGGSIIMDLTTVIEDPNWIGVACCAVFVSHHDPSNTEYDSYNSYIGHGVDGVEGNKRMRVIYFHVPLNFKIGLVTVEMDHLSMVLFNRNFFTRWVRACSRGMSDIDKIQFKCYVSDPPGLRLEVKSYGCRLLFEEDLQHLKSDMMFNANSSYRKRKRLTNT